MKLPQLYSIMLCFSCLIVIACNNEESITPAVEVNTESEPLITSFSSGNLEVIASGFEIPWGIEIISENEFLVTERIGELYHYKNGEIHKVENIPGVRLAEDDAGIKYGGLMDVSLHPQYEQNQRVYIAYVAPDGLLRIARFKLQEDRALNFETLFTANGFSIGTRIEWQDDTHFFFSLGMGGNPYPEIGAQNMQQDRGKIHRLREDGSIPRDNPLLPGKSAPSSIWSYGHRNPQGLYYNKANEMLYANEHGPMGGDELNQVLKGENYGWPLFSYGLNYNRTAVSEMSESDARAETQLPMKYWTHDFRVAPSGLLYLEGSKFFNWNGSFLMGALNPHHLLRYHAERDQTEIALPNVGRVRDIAQLPSGNLLILVDRLSVNPETRGRILKLIPK